MEGTKEAAVGWCSNVQHGDQASKAQGNEKRQWAVGSGLVKMAIEVKTDGSEITSEQWRAESAVRMSSQSLRWQPRAWMQFLEQARGNHLQNPSPKTCEMKTMHPSMAVAGVHTDSYVLGSRTEPGSAHLLPWALTEC